jgi:hypothetical protein
MYLQPKYNNIVSRNEYNMNQNNDSKAICLPRGGVLWVHNHTGVNQNYIIEYMKNPETFKGSPTAASKILEGIEAFNKHQEKVKLDNDKRLNRLLATSKE